jgi:hypothetical protein
MTICSSGIKVRTTDGIGIQRRYQTRLFITAAACAALMSSVHGQIANQAEVGREISRTQRPIPFQSGFGQGNLGAPVQELPLREEYGPLRVLYNARPPPTFTVQTFAGAFYTTNAALLPNHEIDDWYFLQGVSLSWSKPIYQSTLFPHASLYQAWFEYTKTGAEGIENFSAMDVDVGITYALKNLANIAVSVDYVYERLADLALGDEIFQENHLIFGLNKVFAISRTHSAFVQGFADISLSTTPFSTERNEYGASIGYAIEWIPEVTTALSYRYALYDYAEGRRADNNQTFALSLIWRVRPAAFLQLGVNYVLNNSNIQSFDYNVFNGGPTASINIQW